MLILCFIIVWLTFSGAGGFGFQNMDYAYHNGLLKDLIVRDWPLMAVHNHVQVHIVYNFGYYLPAAVIGKAFGWVSANIFLFLWTLSGVLLAYFWFWNLSRVRIKKNIVKLALFTTIFCLAGGLDYIGYYVLKRNTFGFRAQVEWWAGFFQYSSNTTLIYWVPQHTIAPWLIIGLIADAFYDKHNLKYLGMVLAGGILWTPFGLVGIIPYLLALGFVYLKPQNRSYLFNRSSVIFNGLSIGIGSIYLLFLGSNQFQFPVGWIWEFSDNYISLVKTLLAFWFLEFAFLGSLILLLIGMGIFFSRTFSIRNNWHDRIDKLEREFGITSIQFCLFIISFCVLFLLPFFKMGIYNDFVMRASIPSLFIFWAFVAKIVTNVSFRIRWKFDLLYTLIIVTIFIGFFTSIAEIARSTKRYHFGPPPFGEVLPMTDMDISERIGNDNTIFFDYFGK
jgi:hypothetical protein